MKRLLGSERFDSKIALIRPEKNNVTDSTVHYICILCRMAVKNIGSQTIYETRDFRVKIWSVPASKNKIKQLLYPHFHFP